MWSLSRSAAGGTGASGTAGGMAVIASMGTPAHIIPRRIGPARADGGKRWIAQAVVAAAVGIEIARSKVFEPPDVAGEHGANRAYDTDISGPITVVLVLLASMTSAAAQTTGGSPSGSTSAPGAASPAAPNAGTRGLSPGAVTPPGAPGVTDPRTGTPLPPNSGPRTPDASTYTNHPGTMPQPTPGQQGQETPGPGRAQPGQASSRPGAAQSANSDGYAECMSMWNPETNRASREDWSKTCERTRLPPR